MSEKGFLEKHEECRGLDAHELMIARLGDEKKVREQLEGERKELVARKQALIAENKRRKEDLASLDEQLQKFSKWILRGEGTERLMRVGSREFEADSDDVYERVLIPGEIEQERWCNGVFDLVRGKAKKVSFVFHFTGMPFMQLRPVYTVAGQCVRS